MKSLFLGLAAFAAVASQNVNAASPALNLFKIEQAILQAAVQTKALNAINWQVGEFHNIDVNAEGLGKLGDGTKSVTKDVPAQNAFWYVTDIAVFGQQQKTEALMSREDGRVLKLIVNGKEQDPSEDGGKIEIIDQKETTIEVPAGKFDCMYIKAKITGKQEAEIEAWINQVDVNLDGMLKLVIKGGMLPIELVLTKFGKK